MQDLDYKEVLVQYGHIVAIAICIAFNAFWVYSSGDTQADTLYRQVDNTRKKIQIKLLDPSVPTPPKEDYNEMVKKNWEISDSISESPNYQSIYPAAIPVITKEIPPEDQWINKPAGITIKVGKEKITLNWRAPRELKKDGKKKQPTKIDGYELIKEWKDFDGKSHTKTIVRKSNSLSYTDKRVETRIWYHYHVRAFSYNTEAKGGTKGKVKGKDVILSDFTKKVKGKLESLYKIALKGMGGKDMAFVELFRYYKGKEHSTTGFIKKGDEIKILNVKVSGLKERIDFRPGWKLVDMTRKAERTKTITVIESKIVKGELVKEKVKKKVKYYVPAIMYIDEKKQERRAYKD